MESPGDTSVHGPLNSPPQMLGGMFHHAQAQMSDAETRV